MRSTTQKRTVQVPMPQPLFDTLEHFLNAPPTLPSSAPDYGRADLEATIDFLSQYTGNQSTFNAYRREIERLLHWAWDIKKQSITTLDNAGIEDYIKFCQNPPQSWINDKKVARFILQEGQKIPNPNWRPFTQNVISRSEHNSPYKASKKTINEIFVALGSFYSYLLYKGFVQTNPVQLIRQKSKFIQTIQGPRQVRKLSELQWQSLIETAERMADENPEYHERTLFMISAMYLMYLRISELGSSPRWEPQMNHFYRDNEGNWWFVTVGKGNKKRQIAVCTDMLRTLKRWRNHLNLPDLPSPGEDSPLLPTLRGRGVLRGTRHIRTLVTHCFERAANQLDQEGFKNDAESLRQASVHWLRHTGISDDINRRGRPLLHVRDDAGHSSLKTTEIYNDANLQERHYSARKKTMKNS